MEVFDYTDFNYPCGGGPTHAGLSNMALDTESVHQLQLRAGVQSLRPLLLGIGAVLLAYLCLRMVTPFLPAVCWALALAIVAEPIRACLLRRIVPRSITALIIITVVLAVLIGPGVILVRALASEASDVMNRVANDAGTKNSLCPAHRLDVAPNSNRRVSLFVLFYFVRDGPNSSQAARFHSFGA
jgi:hypothetical protein